MKEICIRPVTPRTGNHAICGVTVAQRRNETVSKNPRRKKKVAKRNWVEITQGKQGINAVLPPDPKLQRERGGGGKELVEGAAQIHLISQIEQIKTLE